MVPALAGLGCAVRRPRQPCAARSTAEAASAPGTRDDTLPTAALRHADVVDGEPARRGGLDPGGSPPTATAGTAAGAPITRPSTGQPARPGGGPLRDPRPAGVQTLKVLVETGEERGFWLSEACAQHRASAGRGRAHRSTARARPDRSDGVPGHAGVTMLTLSGAAAGRRAPPGNWGGFAAQPGHHPAAAIASVVDGHGRILSCPGYWPPEPPRRCAAGRCAGRRRRRRPGRPVLGELRLTAAERVLA
ncbi:hypothetical protein HBB16_10235 [Pseudonocardia sp. MCCB 268]|nr:hypothetical protein [Pseudonocardia cytotoxica]